MVPTFLGETSVNPPGTSKQRNPLHTLPAQDLLAALVAAALAPKALDLKNGVVIRVDSFH